MQLLILDFVFMCFYRCCKTKIFALDIRQIAAIQNNSSINVMEG